MVPAIVGLPTDASEDALKALGAAAASSGGVAMFHAVGRTPEAANLAEATGGTPPDRVIDIDMAMLAEARSELSTRVDGPLAAVSVGTPHFSVSEFRILASLISGRTVAPEVEFYVNTSREVLAEAATLGLVALLRAAGIEIVTDTCTYVTPIMRERSGSGDDELREDGLLRTGESRR